MKISERIALLKAGYSRAEIEEMRKEEDSPIETSEETAEDTTIDTSGETVKETIEEINSNDSQENNPLLKTIEELQETIREMQRINLMNARQPEVSEKSPLDNASDILFNVYNDLEE